MKYRVTRLLAILALPAIAFLPGVLAPSAAADSPVLSVSPDFFAFGPINIGGELGEPGEFTVSNPGTDPVHLDTVGITGPDRFSFVLLPNASSCFFLEVPGQLDPGKSCMLVTQFDPEKEGPNQASLELVSDSSTSPDLMLLTGTGFPELLPGATLVPQVLDFGRQKPGTTSAVKAITLISSGSGDLDIGPVMISGINPGEFEVTSNNCSGRVMASGDSCRIDVRFLPGGPGSRSAELKVITDASGADTTSVLTGTGFVKSPVGTSRVLVAARLPRTRSALQGVPLRCVTDSMRFCRGEVKLRVRGHDLGLGRDGLVSIGSRSYALRSGTGRVSVRLENRALRHLRSRGSLKVRVTVSSRQGDGEILGATFVRTLRR